MSNPNYDQLLASTLANYGDKFEDNVFADRYLLWILSTQESVKKVGGGTKIVEQLMIGKGQAQGYSEWEQVTITPQTGFTAAEYPWRNQLATIAISGQQELMNRGEEEIIDLLEGKVTQSQETLRDKINSDLFGTTAGYNPVKDFASIDTYIGATGTVGGIDSAVYDYWRSYVADMATAGAGGTPLAKTELQKQLAKAYNTSSKGTSDHVKYIVSDQGSFELYESQLVPQVRYEDVASANAGFTTLKYKNVPWGFDEANPEGTIFGINPKYLRVKGHKDRWFKQSKFTENPASSAHASNGSAAWVDGRYATITLMGNLTMSNRSRHFKLVNVGDMT